MYVGTVALMKKKENVYELTKMAIVIPEKRGKNMGQYLMDYCIDFAKITKT